MLKPLPDESLNRLYKPTSFNTTSISVALVGLDTLIISYENPLLCPNHIPGNT